jgi:hypothetical protein
MQCGWSVPAQSLSIAQVFMQAPGDPLQVYPVWHSPVEKHCFELCSRRAVKSVVLVVLG